MSLRYCIQKKYIPFLVGCIVSDTRDIPDEAFDELDILLAITDLYEEDLKLIKVYGKTPVFDFYTIRGLVKKTIGFFNDYCVWEGAFESPLVFFLKN